MYFVVRLLILGKNVILPTTWIHGIDEHMEKFINNSLNCTQKFLCYYTNKTAAFDNGRPIPEFEPDFAADMVTNINSDGTFDGCFYGKLQHYSLEFDGAERYVNAHRNIGRPIYNYRRLNERPVPSLGHHSQSRDTDEEHNLDWMDSSNSDISTQNESADLSIEQNTNESNFSNENSVGITQELNDSVVVANGDDSTNPTVTNNGDVSEEAIDINSNLSQNGDEDTDDPLAFEANDSVVANDGHSTDCIVTDHDDAGEQAIDTNSNSNLSNSDEEIVADPLVIVKTEVPMQEFHAANSAEIDEILEEAEEIVCDDGVVMLIGKNGVPMPWAATDDKLIKREKDLMSGDIPFNCTKEGRVYKIGELFIVVPQKAIDHIIGWNKGKLRDELVYDRKVCRALLLSLVPKDKLLVSDVCEEVVEFVKACFKVRCGIDEERITKIDTYMKEFARPSQQKDNGI